MEYWKGKIAVVTGASSGIGAAIALDLANAGVEVIGLARRKFRIEELAKETSGKICAIECDVSKIDSITSAFKEISEKFGKVHILVNNAGRTWNGRTLDAKLSHEELVKTVNINLSGLVICTREAHKLMQNHKDYCFIVNVNSILGHCTPFYESSVTNIYGATKVAVTNHTQTVRLELAHSPDAARIRISSVSPGLAKTEILEASGAPKQVIDHIWKKVKIDPKDVADAIHFILSTPPTVNVTELTIRPTGETV